MKTRQTKINGKQNELKRKLFTAKRVKTSYP